MIAGLITNGYLLVPTAFSELNRAGLEWLQISIDNVNPDEVSKKSLKVLDKKLQLLAEHADFHVNINSVVGGGITHPQDALTIGKRATRTWASLRPSASFTTAAASCSRSKRKSAASITRCRRWKKAASPGSTHFRTTSRRACPTTGDAAPVAAISTFAKTDWFITARSSAAIPEFLWRLTRATTLRREYLTEKPCAPHCTVSCVHQVSIFDSWRSPQEPAIVAPSSVAADELVQIK
jgi:hypothetical protein